MTRLKKYILRFLSASALLFLMLIGIGIGLTDASDFEAGYQNRQSSRVEDSDNPTGKTPAIEGAQPWMVALVDADTDNAYDGQFCGGSLVGPEWVLTAAHCVEENSSPEEIDLVIGRHVLSSDEGERITAAEVYIHEGYFDYDDNQDNDIALIKLSRPATVGTPINTVTDATEYTDDPGTVARATGWGIFSDDSDDFPDELHGVDIPVVTQATCKTTYGSDLLPDGLCAGLAEGGKDTCRGDSGGPLVSEDRNGNPVQIGVVSWGDECGAPGSYGVYARLTEYEQWQRDVRNGDVEPTDMSELGWGGDWDWDWWGDESDDTDEGDVDEDDWFEDEDADAEDGYVAIDSAELPDDYDLIWNDTFDGEQWAMWENWDAETVELYATENVYESLEDWANEVGVVDGRYTTINGVEVLLEQFEDEDGTLYESAAYIDNGILVEIYSMLAPSDLQIFVESLLN